MIFAQFNADSVLNIDQKIKSKIKIFRFGALLVQRANYLMGRPGLGRVVKIHANSVLIIAKKKFKICE